MWIYEKPGTSLTRQSNWIEVLNRYWLCLQNTVTKPYVNNEKT